MTKIDPLIAIGLPTWGKVSISWAQSYRHLGGPLGANTVELAPVIGEPIAKARNQIMQAAIDNHADFLFMLGDDVLAPSDAIIRMLQRMWDDPKLTLVSGMYWTKHWPAQPYIWRGVQRGPYMDWKHGEFFEIDYAGCDCLLIRLTDEIKALGPEWFSTEWKWNRDDGPTLIATEDFFFYTKTRKAGIKLWCDSNIQCIHEDRNTGIQYALLDNMPQYRDNPGYTGPPPVLPEARTDAAPLVKVADIGAGFEGPFFGTSDEVQVVRFDGNEKTGPDYRCDIRRLPAPDQSYDVVHSRHALEHFGRDETLKLLREWTRILRVGGELRLSVPNLLHAIGQIMMMDEGIIPIDPYPWWQLYGQQTDEHDFHYNGFTPKRLRAFLVALDIFEDIDVKTSGGADNDLNIQATARKVRHPEANALLPEWDEIEQAEGFKMAGLTHDLVVAFPEGSSGTPLTPEDWDIALATPKRPSRRLAKEAKQNAAAARNGVHA